jgi:small GTP-binding protein
MIELPNMSSWIHTVIEGGVAKIHDLRAPTKDLTVQLTVTSMSGEIVAELMMPGSATVHEVKKTLAQHAETSTPVGRCTVIFQERILSNDAVIRDLIEEEQSRKCTLQLIRLGSRAFADNMTCPGSSKYDLLCKFLLVGDSGTGKSNIMLRFADGVFTDSFISTIGIDFKVRSIAADDEAVVAKLQIWDTAGQERFRAIPQAYYRVPDVILLVFDVSVRESFDKLTDWLDTIRRHTSTNLILYLVGNKTDLVRKVSLSEAEDFAASNGLQYFEMSAKTGADVNAPFNHGTGVLMDKAGL